MGLFSSRPPEFTEEPALPVSAALGFCFFFFLPCSFTGALLPLLVMKGVGKAGNDRLNRSKIPVRREPVGCDGFQVKNRRF